jgi:hypothetical protein
VASFLEGEGSDGRQVKVSWYWSGEVRSDFGGGLQLWGDSSEMIRDGTQNTLMCHELLEEPVSNIRFLC